MEYMLIFDVVIAGLGAFLIYTAHKMKNTGEISTIVVNREEMPRCKNKKGFIQAIATKTVYFGVVSLSFGILAIVNDLCGLWGRYFNIIGSVVFMAAWFWFSNELRKSKGEFFY